MLQCLYMYVANICSQCFICFSAFVASVFYLNIAYVLHICCECFIWMLRMFYNSFQVFLGVFASVSDACFKYFICFQTYVTNVSSECFKSRSVVPHVAMAPADSGLLQGFGS
jgi:hypothetical protein